MFARGKGRWAVWPMLVALASAGGAALLGYWAFHRLRAEQTDLAAAGNPGTTTARRGSQLPLEAAKRGGSNSPTETPQRLFPTVATAAVAPADVEAFCGACHATPRPDRAPREVWDTEIRTGYQRYRETGRQDLTVPPVSHVAAYYREHAPSWAEWHPPPQAPSEPARMRFEHTDIVAPGGTRDPFVAGLAVIALGDDKGPAATRFVFTDMRNGQVAATGPRWTSLPTEICERLGSPCHVEPCDLDQDGRTDLLVSDLGGFSAGDHHRGKVVWLRATGDAGHEDRSYRDSQAGHQRIDLATGLGRVADARPGDFDGDGDLDVVVAEFGFERTGRIVLLENRAIGGDSADFALHVVDPRHGTIHVPVTDLNHDGHLDFVALISQEYEVVEVFLGRGDLSFDRQTIFAAEDPSYASSGIELVDLDADDDLDVLYVNGDCFDGAYMKPYHAVQWLENTGGYPYEHHLLAHMPGASRAVAGDLDGDGDLDIVAASMLVPKMLNDHGAENFDSLVWFEQTAPGRFERHGLEKSKCDHFGLELGDFDFDGDLDMAVGNAIFGRPPRGQEPPALTIWWNQRVSPSSAEEGKKMGMEQRATTETKRESQNAK